MSTLLKNFAEAQVSAFVELQAMLDVELQLDQVQEALAEETARAEGLVRETERLARENEQLQRQLMMQKAHDAVCPSNVSIPKRNFIR